MLDELKYEIIDEVFCLKEKILLEKAEAGDASIAYELARLYFEYEDREQEAYEWFLKAAEQKHPDAVYYLGNFYDNPYGFGVVEPDEETAVKYWQDAVELGSALAMCELGQRYRMTGLGVEKDEAKAIELFKMAAEKKFHKAFYLLAVCYKNGNGVEKDIEKAYDYYRMAYSALEYEMLLRP